MKKKIEGIQQGIKNCKNYLIQNITGDISKEVTTQYSLRKVCNIMTFVSQIEPKEVGEDVIEEINLREIVFGNLFQKLYLIK